MGITIQHGTDYSGLGQNLMAGLQLRAQVDQEKARLEEIKRARKFQETLESEQSARAAAESQRSQERWDEQKKELERERGARKQQGEAIDAGFETEGGVQDVNVPIPTPFGPVLKAKMPGVPAGMPPELWGSYKQVQEKLKTLDDPEAKKLLLDQAHKAWREHANLKSLDEFGKRVGADQMHGVFQADPNSTPDPREQELINRQSQITTTLAELKKRAGAGEQVDWNQLHGLQKQYDDLQTMVMDVRKERADREFVIGKIRERMGGFSGSLRQTQKANDLIERVRMRKVDAGAALKELGDITEEPDLWGDGNQSFEDADPKVRGTIQREAAKEAFEHLRGAQEYKDAGIDERRKMENDALQFYTRSRAESYGWRTDLPGTKGQDQSRVPPVLRQIMPVYQAFVQQFGRKPTREEFVQFAQSQGGGGQPQPAPGGGSPAQPQPGMEAAPEVSPEDAPLPEGVFDPIESGAMRIGSKSGKRSAYFRKLEAMAEDIADYQNDPQHTSSSNAPINLFGSSRPGKKLKGHDDQAQEAFSQLSTAIEDFERRYGPLTAEERAKLEGMKWAKR